VVKETAKPEVAVATTVKLLLYAADAGAFWVNLMVWLACFTCSVALPVDEA
jgi:hypothetical protein